MWGSGKTVVLAVVLLPGNVTNLVIERPVKFDFWPGDWIFLNIPAISFAEWHPFTLTSAPEQKVNGNEAYNLTNLNYNCNLG